jgi:hypothetical protein
MLHEIIPFVPASKSASGNASRSVWVHYPKHLLQHPGVESEGRCDQSPENPRFHAHECTGVKRVGDEGNRIENASFDPGHSLFQEVFFFCTVKGVGDVPGAGCIYVETVVDRDSGIAFAKIYSAKNAMNAVDILTSRVVPFYESQGASIKEIHTRKTSEYCGLPLAHPFETLLATSHIQHLPMDLPGHPHNHLCEQFYRFLLKEFFGLALRKKFKLSLDDLQKDLDTFVEAYNALQMRPKIEIESLPQPSANFPVDL